MRRRVLGRFDSVRLLQTAAVAILMGLLAGCATTGTGHRTAAPADARELTLDVRPWSVDAALAWRVSSGHLLGFSLGGGPDDFNRTFVPRVTPQDSEYITLEQIIRLGPFYRYELDSRLHLDLGLRVALGGVRGISGSPGVVTGVQAGVYYGGRHVRVGPRLFAGAAHEAGASERVVHVDWLTARLRLPF